jgi:hypothetical protein
MGNGNKIFRKTIGLEIMKRAVRISSELQKIRDWTLWRGPPKTEEEPTHIFSVRRAGNVGAPANLNSSAPNIGKEKEEKVDVHSPGLTGTL